MIPIIVIWVWTHNLLYNSLAGYFVANCAVSLRLQKLWDLAAVQSLRLRFCDLCNQVHVAHCVTDGLRHRDEYVCLYINMCLNIYIQAHMHAKIPPPPPPLHCAHGVSVLAPGKTEQKQWPWGNWVSNSIIRSLLFGRYLADAAFTRHAPVDASVEVLQGAAQRRGGQFYFVFAVLQTLFSCSKNHPFDLKTCTPLKATPWSTAWAPRDRCTCLGLIIMYLQAINSPCSASGRERQNRRAATPEVCLQQLQDWCYSLAPLCTCSEARQQPRTLAAGFADESFMLTLALPPNLIWLNIAI